MAEGAQHLLPLNVRIRIIKTVQREELLVQAAFVRRHGRLHFFQYRLRTAFVFKLAHAGGRVHQKLRHQHIRLPLQLLPFLLPKRHERRQCRRLAEQRGQLLPQHHFARKIKRHGIETAADMQAAARQKRLPFVHVLPVDKIKHRHHRLRAPRQHRQFIFVFGQHVFTRVHHIQSRIAGQHLPQHFRLLRPFVLRGRAVQKLLQPLNALLLWRSVFLQPIQHAARIFQARRIVQIQPCFHAVAQSSLRDMARGRRRIFHFAEAAVAQQRAH